MQQSEIGRSQLKIGHSQIAEALKTSRFCDVSHHARHGFGTLAISAGLSIESIAKMMGHANINTTTSLKCLVWK